MMKTFDDLVFKLRPISYLKVATMEFGNGFDIYVYPDHDSKDKFNILISKNKKICYANGMDDPLSKERITSIMVQLQKIKKQ